MRVTSRTWSASLGWSQALPAVADDVQLILSFGPVESPSIEWFDEVQHHWPTAQHVYCSGGGQISDGVVQDDDVVLTTVHFDGAAVHPVVRDGVDVVNSTDAGERIGAELAKVSGLRHVLVFAEGLALDAASFVAGMNTMLPADVQVTGGLASNGIALSRTSVGLNGPPASGRVVAIGLSGESLVVGTGSVGGWEFFGPERVVTRAGMSEVFELDGERALDVYKRYLGEFAKELPGSALLFPLAVRSSRDGPVAVRTILAIDDAAGSMRFAGNIPEGSIARLMRTTTDRLIDGAGQAAEHAGGPTTTSASSLTLCISCIGRRAVMRSRVDEEIEEVIRVTGGNSTVVGFYSNGEIAPPTDGREHARAVLHNQTMTITTLSER